MTAAPAIVSRSAWGANPLHTPAGAIATPSHELWLHHTASTGLHGPGGMRSLQANALAGGYVDFEYTFAVDNPDATVYESRGPGRNTAATVDHNEISHAFVVLGNFELDHPADRVLDVLGQLTAWGHEQGWWPAQITGPHRDASGNATACCGRYLIDAIPEINRRAAAGVSPGPPHSQGGAMAICRTPSGRGYWICADDGGVFAFGDARFFGSMGGHELTAPVVGMAAAPKGDGYVLAAADGGVFAFGSVKYRGGMGGQRLDAPITGVELDAEGDGYWLLAADGGVFTFGATTYYGNATEYIG